MLRTTRIIYQIFCQESTAFDAFVTLHILAGRSAAILFKFDHCDAGFTLTVASKAEGFDALVALEHLLDGGAQRACALAVDYRDRL